MTKSNSGILMVSEEDRKAFSYHVIINVEHRFIFFTIPKVACTSWIQLFLRLQGDMDWRDNPHDKNNRPFLSHHSCEQIQSYLIDPTWTKAVFFRDPLERFLSAYLNKIEPGSYITRRLFNAGAGEISFKQFVEIAANHPKNSQDPRGLHSNTDPHWKPQYLTANIEKYLPWIDFVGDFSNLQNDARKLLEKVGLWTEFGATGWGANEDKAMFETNNAQNKTNAKERYQEFYEGDMASVTRKAYSKDYHFLSQCGLN